MLNIQVFTVNMLMENCYVVWDSSLEAVIIDCGACYAEERASIAKFINATGLKVVRLLCTHGHFDHIMGDEFVFEQYGVKPELNGADLRLYNQCNEQFMDFLGEKVSLKLPAVDSFLDEGDEVEFGSHVFRVLSTPGHTPGGISYYCKEEAVVFSGDSIFRHSIGRTDFTYGDSELLVRKLKENILTLPNDTRIMPGHGHPSTVGEEKVDNPFFAGMYN